MVGMVNIPRKGKEKKTEPSRITLRDLLAIVYHNNPRRSGVISLQVSRRSTIFQPFLKHSSKALAFVRPCSVVLALSEPRISQNQTNGCRQQAIVKIMKKGKNWLIEKRTRYRLDLSCKSKSYELCTESTDRKGSAILLVLFRQTKKPFWAQGFLLQCATRVHARIHESFLKLNNVHTNWWTDKMCFNFFTFFDYGSSEVIALRSTLKRRSIS